MNEDKTSIEKLANMNLEGLLLLEPDPVSYGWLWVFIGLLLLVIRVVLGAWRKKHHAPKATALRTLRLLQKNLDKSINENIDKNKQDAQSIKEQVALSLRQGFNVTRLDKIMPNNLKWRAYLNTLETTLYAGQKTAGHKSNKQENETLLSLITNAQTWLRNS